MEKLGKYEILGKLGAGGFGIVYKGRDPFIERLVAIKTCSAEDESLRQRFFQEAKISGNLRHPNITTVYDFGLEGEVPYLVQEYLTGEDLDRVIARGELMTLERKLDILVDVARGLDHAHSEGIVHRDVKPANVRILDDESVKIMDFGIAKVSLESTGLTRTGTALGTVCYFSPEQFQGKAVDTRSDIFSFGILAYELLCHQRPFQGSNPAMLMKQILMEDPEPISAWWPDCPDRLEDAVMRCLEKRLDRRYPNLQEFIEQIEEIREEMSPPEGAAGDRPNGARPEAAASPPSPSPSPSPAAAPEPTSVSPVYQPLPPLDPARSAAVPLDFQEQKSQRDLLRDLRRKIQELLRQGDLEAAERCLQQVERDFPDAKSFWFYRDRLEKLRRQGGPRPVAARAEKEELQPCAPELMQLLSQIYQRRRTGILHVVEDGVSAALHFRDGELHLPVKHSRAAYAQQMLDALLSGDRSGAQLQLRKLAREVVLASGAAEPDSVSFEEQSGGEGRGEPLVGPLLTVYLLIDLVVGGYGRRELRELFDDEAARFQSRADTPALEQLPSLDSEMTQVLTRLDAPTALGQLLRGIGGEPTPVLRGLAKLLAVGLAVQLEAEKAAGEGAEEEGEGEKGFSSKVVRRFAERIEEDLRAEPVELPGEEHRELLADLLRRLGEMNHYELLGLSPTASSQEIHQAYNALARKVHPVHAGHIGLEGKETAFEVLFERATEAYLTLSDPGRRSSYNMVSGLFEGVAVDPAQREREQRALARQNYRHGARLLSSMDFSQAVDLLKEAARIDPQPDYLTLLGQAQSKNPQWWNHAEESYKRAIDASPGDVRAHLGYAELLESMGETESAGRQYQEVLEIDPQHPTALLSLERLGIRPKGRSGVLGSFGRRSKKAGKD